MPINNFIPLSTPIIDYHVLIADKNLKFLESEYVPDNLFHFTKQREVANEIFSNSKLWAMDLMSMEDQSEFNYGVKLFEQVLKKRKLSGYLSSVIQFIQKEIHTNRTMSFFVTCFTKNELNHQHWLKYANNYSGACLKFRKQEVFLDKQHQKIIGNQNMNLFQISPVYYDEQYQKRLFNKLIDTYVSFHNKIVLPGNSNQLAEMRWLLLGVYQCVVVFSTIFKRRKFSWEKEYRGLVMLTYGTPLINSKGRCYVELDSKAVLQVIC
jgi:hypothetical protein